MKKQNPIEMEVVARMDGPSDKEMRDRGLRILARIIARRYIQNTHSKDVLTRQVIVRKPRDKNI